MKVAVERKASVTEDVDIAFPLYIDASDSTDGGGSWDSLYRIEADGTFYSVTRREYRGRDVEWEFKATKIDLRRDLGMYLDARYARVTAEKFATHLAQCREALSAFPKP